MQYSNDPNTNGTTLEIVYVYFLTEGGKLQAELDRHIVGLFPLGT